MTNAEIKERLEVIISNLDTRQIKTLVHELHADLHDNRTPEETILAGDSNTPITVTETKTVVTPGSENL